MTSAEKPTAAELLAERFGPAGVDGDGPRVRFIATLHALIAFFTEHPEIPAPWAIAFHVRVPHRTALAELVDAGGWSEPYGNHPQIARDICRDPVWAHVIAAVEREDRPL